jgi:hypothetical protein
MESAELRGALGVADLAVSQAEHPVDEELNDAGEDEGNDENDGDPGQIVLEEVDEGVVPAVFEALKGSLIVGDGRCRGLELQQEAG